MAMRSHCIEKKFTSWEKRTSGCVTASSAAAISAARAPNSRRARRNVMIALPSQSAIESPRCHASLSPASAIAKCLSTKWSGGWTSAAAVANTSRSGMRERSTT